LLRVGIVAALWAFGANCFLRAGAWGDAPPHAPDGVEAPIRDA
jgi:hypothetical protein